MRAAIFVLAQALPAILWSSGWLPRVHADLFVWALEHWGPAPVTRTGPITFEIGRGSFFVEHWCTPVWIWCGGVVILFSAGVPTVRAIVWAAILTLLGLAASTANVVYGVRVLAEGTATWDQVHVPITAVIYTTAFLVYVFIAWRYCAGRQKAKVVAQPSVALE